MVTILIIGIVLAMSLWVFKLYWKDICDWCARTVKLAAHVVGGVITFVVSGGKVIAYLYRRLKDGNIQKQQIPAPRNLNPDEVPEDVRVALMQKKEVLVNDDVTRPVNING